MKIKLLVVGMLVLGFLCGLMGLAVWGLAPTPAQNPAAWAQTAQAASSDRLFAFLGFLAFGGGCWQFAALLVCLGAFIWLVVRGIGPGGRNLQ